MPDTPLQLFKINPTSSVALFQQIYEALRQHIVSGHLRAGDRLPPTRKFAEELGVSRTTIVTAYDQLIAEGFANPRSGSGIYVSEIGDIEYLGSKKPEKGQAPISQSRRESPKAFQPGHPDMRLFPYKQWAKCVARVARTAPESLVTSSDPFGDPALRTEICRYLADWRDIKTSPAEIIVTAGASDALELCFRTLLIPGQNIALEDPCYPPLRAFAESLSRPITYLDMDNQGAIPPTIKKNKTDPKVVVLTPSSQFPLGGTMPQARRNAFLKWAAETNKWIIEDDYDSEFRFAGRPFPALAGLDQRGRTLYIGTFSKIFTNGLRLGFLVIPPGFISNFQDELKRYGVKASITPQRPLSEFMKSGEFYKHIRRVRRIYSERRKAFIEHLETEFADLISFQDNRAGMQIAVFIPNKVKDTDLVKRAVEKGISCTALSTYYAAKPQKNGLLLGFCSFSVEEISRAMTILRTLFDPE